MVYNNNNKNNLISGMTSTAQGTSGAQLVKAEDAKDFYLLVLQLTNLEQVLLISKFY